jgi:DeoR/GlpR family transcriptional regulator of sugar metabolism
MTPSERQEAIVEYLDAMRVCSYQDLSTRYGVSEMTIRRDVDRLALQNGLIKTLGGAQTAHAPHYLYESPLRDRLLSQREEKRQIARTAVRRIGSRQTIFLDGSTTCLVLARHLAKKSQGLTVVTYSALVCREFGETTKNVVFCLGGQFDPSNECFTGPVAEEAARQFSVDIAFCSTKGFLPQEGTFESSIATFRIKQIMAGQAVRTVLLVDHTKFGLRSLCKVFDTGQIQEVITDAATSASDVASLEERGVTVTVATESRAPLEEAIHAF